MNSMQRSCSNVSIMLQPISVTYLLTCCVRSSQLIKCQGLRSKASTAHVQTTLCFQGSSSSSESSSGPSFGSSSGCSSGSSSGSGSSGGDHWRNKVNIVNQAESAGGGRDEVQEKDPKISLEEDEEVNEDVEEVMAYKVPLSSYQLTSFLMYHMYIVIKTKSEWWSIEKHTDGITIQKGNALSFVRNTFCGSPRGSGITCMSTDKSKVTIKLIKHFILRYESHKGYSLLSKNCQHFATQLFNFSAKTKQMQPAAFSGK